MNPDETEQRLKQIEAEDEKFRSSPRMMEWVWPTGHVNFLLSLVRAQQQRIEKLEAGCDRSFCGMVFRDPIEATEEMT